MKKHLIIVEHNNNNITSSTYSAICAASKIDGTKVGLILCKDDSTAKKLSLEICQLVDKIIYIKNDQFKHRLSQPYAHCIEKISLNLDVQYIWGGSSSFTKETLPRVCARIADSCMASDVQKVLSEDTFERPMWAGDVISTIKLNKKIKILSVRPTDFKQSEIMPRESKADLEETLQQIASTTMSFVEFEEVKSDRPSLSDASVIVAGGRGLKTPENFKDIIYPLADTLNAAIGASRAICDADWVPNDWQVGQTGKVVAPELYFAIGISGAIQHVAGMRGSKTIVAINKDPEAPIFQVADYGIVGDASVIVPELTEKIKSML